MGEVTFDAVGWRDRNERALPDVLLTGDEFLHLMAVQGETLPGNPTAHVASRVPLGFPSPDCEACSAVMDKNAAWMRDCERLGLIPVG